MTVRTLVLLRHAKAETPGELPDFDRHLTAAGRSAADAAGSWLADERLRPGLVICSTAARTRETWQGVSVAMAQADPDAHSPEVHYEQSLYDGGRTEVIDLLRAVPDTVHTVLVIGHNPTMSDVSILLRPWEENAVLESLKTSGLAVHRAEGSWSDTEPGSLPLVLAHTARG
ncbi:SixA phosphatase family protein [Actinoplanes friuliensis]|jgi:phosphohistidine phosphatase|uniref:Putative phosphohistidine phosphatase n=1 Tax=Actinoplanes friuliensis DSM 7358 TaxID=1246995 RepID=U5VRT5_9ACTN|nr:histidine phosphatase family protein [Actinoplanes friuliensis]AGZ38376.1 putative phosphohistidine phosphatase [Actinoplanes friuliensis DSM 7358]